MNTANRAIPLGINRYRGPLHCNPGGFTITEMECQTRKKAKERCKYYLSDEYPLYSETTHEQLRTEKAEMLVNDECEWDFFR